VRTGFNEPARRDAPGLDHLAIWHNPPTLLIATESFDLRPRSILDSCPATRLPKPGRSATSG